MIDLHCHLLHSLDDGPQTAEESLQMAHMLEKAGYRKVVATPHMMPGTAWMPSVDQIRSQVSELNRAVRKDGLGLDILAGMEITIGPQILDLIDEGRLLPLGDSDCLLIEPWHQQLPPGWEQLVFSILAKGYRILLAHPERCLQLAADPELIQRLVGMGIYLQADWGSYLGRYGRMAARTARLMAANGWIHCLATDGHRPAGFDPTEMRAAANKMVKLIGQANLKRITTDNPLRLLNGKTPQPMHDLESINKAGRRRWWRFW